MKKILLAFVSALFATSAMAENSFEGFFTHAGIGYQSISGSSNSLTETFTGDPTAYPVTASVSKINTFTQALSAGYSHKIDANFYLGLGVDYNPIATPSANETQTLYYNGAIGVSHATYKLANLYNIYLAPAYAIGDSGLGYLKLGYSATQLKITGGSDTIAPGQVTSYNLNGFILGAGYKQYLTGNVYGFIEGNFNKYQSVSASTTSCSSYCGTMGGNIGLSSYSFLTGIGYKF
ncbi:outer membrane beta-barrel protein [Polynucleobacter paneuropaeus]|nr:outer membrane beta-barrel protein [Polynucleobacter paneuropaeus]QWD23200.1 outer membrane beta-barrel protein [Polynucleobacter paneuropaeus]